MFGYWILLLAISLGLSAWVYVTWLADQLIH